MTERTRASWVVYALGALCLGAIVVAVLVVGPASGSTATVTRTATVAEGVVQSTVSGSGNLQPASQLDLGFKTSGTVTHIYVTQGQQVARGQLIAALDPQSAEVTLEQSKATLQAAEANLAKEEETNGEGSSGAGSGATGSTGSVGATATTADSAQATTTAPPQQPPTQTSTTPAATTPTQTTTRTTSSPTTTTKSSGEGRSSGESKEPKEAKESKSTSTTSTSTTSTISAATREANIASARAAVKSDALTVQSDEQAVENTRLYAPESGTIASLNGQVGEDVSASGTTRATSSSSSSSGSSGTGASATGAAGARASTTGASAASSSTSSSSSAFAVLTDLSSMQLVVPLSESEVGNVHAGQIATVTVEALSGKKLAAHVAEVAILSTSNSGVVSYDVTFALDQMDAGLKPGMSATAEVVVSQAEGINVPTSAITASTVTVVRSGKHVRQRVVTGLAGNSSTIILSGLKAGETIVLPSTSTTSTSGRSSTSSRLGGGGGLGGLSGAGGAGAFFRGPGG